MSHRLSSCSETTASASQDLSHHRHDDLFNATDMLIMVMQPTAAVNCSGAGTEDFVASVEKRLTQ